MLVDIPMKFDYGVFNVHEFRDTGQARLKCLFGDIRFQSAITRKICNPALRFLCSVDL